MSRVHPNETETVINTGTFFVLVKGSLEAKGKKFEGTYLRLNPSLEDLPREATIGEVLKDARHLDKSVTKRTAYKGILDHSLNEARRRGTVGPTQKEKLQVYRKALSQAGYSEAQIAKLEET